MNIDLAEVIAEVSKGRIVQDYSGKGMFGETTCGVIVDDVCELIKCIIEEATMFVDLEDGINDFRNVGTIKIDSMGRGIIVY